MYKRMVSSIAFIPTVMILAALMLGVFVFYFEDYKYTRWLSENLTFVLVSGADNARMVLNTVIAGIISLTVFSFSMVMVVLNRTSDALSPRLLPQLVAQKFHQVVLGFYMGTIVYSLILVISIEPEKNLPALGILISMILAIASLGLFIYFIHSISESIQVNNIMRGILVRTQQQIASLKSTNKNTGLTKGIGQGYGYPLPAPETGYYFHSDSNSMLKFLVAENLKMTIEAPQGAFLLKGEVLALYYPQQPEKSYQDKLNGFFYKSNFLDDANYYQDNLRKISEIAVKALSPGINDPGTALIALRFLTILFEEVVCLPEYLQFMKEETEIQLLEKLPTLEQLLFDTITPIRECSSNLTQIIMALFSFYEALLAAAPEKVFPLLIEHLKALVQSADSSIQNAYDREIINHAIDKIKLMSPDAYTAIPLLKQ
jgi:uncharacterized membrane protein